MASPLLKPAKPTGFLNSGFSSRLHSGRTPVDRPFVQFGLVQVQVGESRLSSALAALAPVRVCAKFIGEKPAGYQPAARCSQNSSQRPLSWEQRRAIIALA